MFNVRTFLGTIGILPQISRVKCRPYGTQLLKEGMLLIFYQNAVPKGTFFDKFSPFRDGISVIPRKSYSFALSPVGTTFQNVLQNITFGDKIPLRFIFLFCLLLGFSADLAAQSKSVNYQEKPIDEILKRLEQAGLLYRKYGHHPV